MWREDAAKQLVFAYILILACVHPLILVLRESRLFCRAKLVFGQDFNKPTHTHIILLKVLSVFQYGLYKRNTDLFETQCVSTFLMINVRY